MNYVETLNYIHSLGMYSNPPHTDLGKIKYLCALFGDPQDAYKTIHVAGTNGKGSTVAMLASIAAESGCKTGRFISPYIIKFNERISIGGRDISDDEIVYYAGKIKLTVGNIPIEYMPNEFEFVTLMGFIYFREKNCDIAIVETGLGGRLDPTNAIKLPLASVITSISLDHTKQLGDTAEKIAAEKCGIIKQNSRVILYPQNKESVVEIVKRAALEKNCRFIMPDTEFLEITDENIEYTKFAYKNKEYTIKLAGRHQAYNAITVIEAANCLFRGDRGIEKAFFPARFEVLSKDPLVIFDGAHNISGVSALKETIKSLLPGKKIILVCGMSRDKHPEEALKEICAEPFVHSFAAVSAGSPRSADPEELCRNAARYCADAGYDNNLQNAVKKALTTAAAGENLAVVFFGSLYLAEGVKQYLI